MSTRPPPANIAPVVLRATDGWELHGDVTVPAGTCVGGVVLVHGGHHERDAFTYGVSVPDLLAAAGLACVRFDIRGRGASRRDTDYHHLPPAQRRAVALDVRAALDHVAQVGGSGSALLGLVGEQDTAAAVVTALAQDVRVGALVLLSPRLGASATATLRARAVPTFALVSKEDRAALRSAVDAYLAAPAAASRLDIFSGLGFGTTMFAARAFEQKDQPALESLVCDWLAATLAPRR